ncbi:MAG: phosphoribosylanthranilate isomerase [Bacteroidales bacterium]
MNSKMKVKVCGLKFESNILAVDSLGIDYAGFIFYEKSPRYIDEAQFSLIANLDINAQRVGVFVNESYETIIYKADACKIHMIQLHGNESVDLCKRLRQAGYRVCKAFSISEAKDFNLCETYQQSCDLFLFDTKCPGAGGSGRSFDWSLLQFYNGTIPFLLSGGISTDSWDDLKRVEHPMLKGYDLNSCFESAPALKNTSLLKKFLIKKQNYESNKTIISDKKE